MNTTTKPAFIRAVKRGYVVHIPLDQLSHITYYGDSLAQFTISPHAYRKMDGDQKVRLSPDEFQAIKVWAENCNIAEKTMARLSRVLGNQA